MNDRLPHSARVSSTITPPSSREWNESGEEKCWSAAHVRRNHFLRETSGCARFVKQCAPTSKIQMELSLGRN